MGKYNKKTTYSKSEVYRTVLSDTDVAFRKTTIKTKRPIPFMMLLSVEVFIFLFFAWVIADAFVIYLSAKDTTYAISETIDSLDDFGAYADIINVDTITIDELEEGYDIGEVTFIDDLGLTYSMDDYIDVTGYTTYTYRDIFGDSLYGEGKTNVIDNGDFDGNDNGWNNDGVYSNGTVILTTVSGSFEDLYQTSVYTSNGLYYYAFDIVDTNFTLNSEEYIYIRDANVEIDGLSQKISIIPKNYNGLRYSVIQNVTSVVSGNYHTFIYELYDDKYLQLDNIMLYYLTDLFVTEPDIDEFEEMLEGYQLRLDEIETHLDLILEEYGDITSEVTIPNPNDHAFYALGLDTYLNYYNDTGDFHLENYYHITTEEYTALGQSITNKYRTIDGMFSSINAMFGGETPEIIVDSVGNQVEDLNGDGTISDFEMFIYRLATMNIND